MYRVRSSIGALAGPALRAVRLSLFLALDSLCELIPARRTESVVILRLDAIGDFFIWIQSGALDITRYARGFGRPVVLAANCTWADYARRTRLWDQVIDVDPAKLMTKPLYRLALMARIRRLGAKLLIQPRAARVFLQEDAITRISGAEVRIGNGGTLINSTEFLRGWGNRYYTRLINVDQERATHETIRNGQFINGLTGRGATPFEISVGSRNATCSSVAIALGAGQRGRVWPVESLAALVRHIKTRHPSLPIVLLGVEADRPLAQRLCALAGGGVDDRVGTTQIHEYVDLIGASTLVICNDSSAYHVAMALRKKVLCFLGGGHYGWFAPYPASDDDPSRTAIVLSASMDCFWCNWRCKYPRTLDGTLLCVASIPIDAAVAAVETLLAP